MSHSAHETRFNIVSFYGLEPTSPRFMPRRTKLRAAHPFAFGVYVVAVNPLRGLHDTRFIEVAARTVNPFSARNHGSSAETALPYQLILMIL